MMTRSAGGIDKADAARSEPSPVGDATTSVGVFDAVDEAVERIVRAARKLSDGPLAGYHPTHLGGCIGPLSSSFCTCGVADIRFGVMALDRALTDARAADLGVTNGPDSEVSRG